MQPCDIVFAQQHLGRALAEVQLEHDVTVPR
jgi:hypothetical protein